MAYSVQAQIQDWLSLMARDLSLDFQDGPGQGHEGHVTDWQNNHDEGHLVSAQVEGRNLSREELRHDFKTEGNTCMYLCSYRALVHALRPWP